MKSAAGRLLKPIMDKPKAGCIGPAITAVRLCRSENFISAAVKMTMDFQKKSCRCISPTTASDGRSDCCAILCPNSKARMNLRNKPVVEKATTPNLIERSLQQPATGCANMGKAQTPDHGFCLFRSSVRTIHSPHPMHSTNSIKTMTKSGRQYPNPTMVTLNIPYCKRCAHFGNTTITSVKSYVLTHERITLD